MISRTSAAYSIPNDEFRSIVSSSYSLTEVTKRCGYKTFKSGGGRRTVASRIKLLGISTNHFRPTGRQYEKPPRNKILDYSDVLRTGSTSNRVTVRDIVLREALINYECVICGNSGEWNGRSLSLQLHHKDGDPTNNQVDNLEFLCPNCHSQTETYGYKNAKRQPKKRYTCTVCGTEITKDSRTGRCRKCAAKLHSVMPSKNELIDVVKSIKYKKYVCFHYGVSETTLIQWLEGYGLPSHISELHRFIKENNL